MYRGMQQACPACGGRLEVLPTPLPCWGCASCGGMWLGPEGTVHTLRGLGDAVDEELAAVSSQRAARSLHPAPPDSGTRGCPWCGTSLSRLPVGPEIVDSCAAHGTWFDRAEVKSVIDTCRRLRARQHRGPLRVLASDFVAAADDFLLVTQQLFGAASNALAAKFKDSLR